MTTNAPAAPAHHLLRNRNFLLLWAAYAVSAFGDHLSEMGLLDLQDALSDKRLDATRVQAIMLFTFMAPFFVLGPFMGWLADRLPRKWIMITADVVRGVLMASLFGVLMYLVGLARGSGFEIELRHSRDQTVLLSPWFYSIPLAVLGIFAAMFAPARAAMLPTLIRGDQLIRANALTNALGPLMSILSFTIGGWLVSKYGAKANFELDACTFALSALIILGIRPPSRAALRDSSGRVFNALWQGFHYVGAHFRVRELIIFSVIFWFAASAVRSTIPALVKAVSGGSITDVGLFNGVLGIGILAGALTLSALGEALRAQIAISWSLILAGISVLGLALVAFAPWLGRWACIVGLFFTGYFGAGILVGTQALIQKIVPDRYRGRVLGVADFFSMAGLLIATGLLGIPNWMGIDRYVPLILGLMAALFLLSGIVAVVVRLRRGRYSPSVNFWVSLSYIYCKAWHRHKRLGPCTIPFDGPVIVAANHVSSIDPCLLVAASPNRCMGFLIAKEYYNTPIVSKLIRDIECVPVSRTGIDIVTIKATLRHLESGKILCMFPQGRIMPPDDREPPREGVGLLALKSGATVIPAYISGVTGGESVIGAMLRRQRAVVRYGKPVDLSEFAGKERDREAFAQASAKIMAAVRALGPG